MHVNMCNYILYICAACVVACTLCMYVHRTTKKENNEPLWKKQKINEQKKLRANNIERILNQSPIYI